MRARRDHADCETRGNDQVVPDDVSCLVMCSFEFCGRRRTGRTACRFFRCHLDKVFISIFYSILSLSHFEMIFSLSVSFSFYWRTRFLLSDLTKRFDAGEPPLTRRQFKWQISRCGSFDTCAPFGGHTFTHNRNIEASELFMTRRLSGRPRDRALSTRLHTV